MALRRETRIGLAMRTVSFNQDVKALVPNSDIMPEFLVYSLQARNREILNLVSSAGSGTGVLDTSLLKRIPIWVPEVGEQQAITEILDDVSDQIGLLERLMTKQQMIKQGMMQQLLTGTMRLPGFFSDWPMRSLGSMLDKLESGISVNSVMDSGTYGVLKTSCVSGGEFDPAECKTVAPSDLGRVKVSPEADSLIISRMNTPALVGEVGYVDADYPSLFLPDRLWLATKKSVSHVNMRWLSYLLSSGQYRERLREVASGTSGSMKNVARRTFLQLSVVAPSIEEQAAIADVLSGCDRQLSMLRTRIKKAQREKEGMLEQLLTDRTRLPVLGGTG
jgi:type I restriction enzyme, S subunit